MKAKLQPWVRWIHGVFQGGWLDLGTCCRWGAGVGKASGPVPRFLLGWLGKCSVSQELGAPGAEQAPVDRWCMGFALWGAWAESLGNRRKQCPSKPAERQRQYGWRPEPESKQASPQTLNLPLTNSLNVQYLPLNLRGERCCNILTSQGWQIEISWIALISVLICLKWHWHFMSFFTLFYEKLNIYIHETFHGFTNDVFPFFPPSLCKIWIFPNPKSPTTLAVFQSPFFEAGKALLYLWTPCSVDKGDSERLRDFPMVLLRVSRGAGVVR